MCGGTAAGLRSRAVDPIHVSSRSQGGWRSDDPGLTHTRATSADCRPTQPGGGGNGGGLSFSASGQLPSSAPVQSSLGTQGLRPNSAGPGYSHSALGHSQAMPRYGHLEQRPHSASVTETGYYPAPTIAHLQRHHTGAGYTQNLEPQWRVGQDQDLGHKLQQHTTVAQAIFQAQQQRGAEPSRGHLASAGSRQDPGFNDFPRDFTEGEGLAPMDEEGPGVLSWLHRLVTGQPLAAGHPPDHTTLLS